MTVSAGVLLGGAPTQSNQGAVVGGEASFMYFPRVSAGRRTPNAGSDWSIGGFAQGEHLGGHGRFALGVQGGQWFGRINGGG